MKLYSIILLLQTHPPKENKMATGRTAAKKHKTVVEAIEEVVVVSPNIVEDYQELNAKCDIILEKITKRKLKSASK